jgi:hypothetical protein
MRDGSIRAHRADAKRDRSRSSVDAISLMPFGLRASCDRVFAHSVALYYHGSTHKYYRGNDTAPHGERALSRVLLHAALSTRPR